jgi:phosphate acetyltransferase
MLETSFFSPSAGGGKLEDVPFLGGGVLQSARERCASRHLRILFPEGDDERIRLAAARILDGYRTLSVTLMSSSRSKHSALREAYPTDRLAILNPEEAPNAEDMAQVYMRLRPNAPEGIALRMARKPLYLSGLLLRSGQVDAMVAGVSCPTARVIEAATLTLGLGQGITVPSSFFIMQAGDPTQSPFLFADCAVNISPSSEELAAIAVASARSWKTLSGQVPRVAFLSFSTHGSANHPEARRIREAATLAARQCPEYHFEGELQADAALCPRVAALKTRAGSEVAGRANVLVFPDLNAANIGYKLVQQFGRATALGPFLQGFTHPISDLSRGATVDEIVDTAIVTASQATLH